MRKVIIGIVILFALLPILPKLIPKDLTKDVVKAELEDVGYSVANDQEVSSPIYEADKQWSMTINGEKANLFFYTNVGVIAKQREYLRKDVGTAIVESWNLAQSLGAAKNPNPPTYVGRNDMYLLVIETIREDFGRQVIYDFERI
jgi:hypothetical protein